MLHPQIIPLSGLALALLVSCSKGHESAPVAERASFDIPQMVVTVESIPTAYMATGTVVSDDRIQVTSRVTAFITDVLVEEGQMVEKGAPLFRLDNADIEGAISQAEAAAAKARAASTDAQVDFERFETLYASQTVTENELRKARLGRDVARDQLRQAEAAMRAARAQRGYAAVDSPVTGIVIARHKQVGDLAMPGAPIVTVESQDAILFETYIAESRIRQIKAGDAVRVRIDALGEGTLEGEVLRIIPSGDPLTRRFGVKVAIDEKTGVLPGMFGRAEFITGHKNAPVLPRSVLSKRGGLTGVFVVDEEGRAWFRWVRLGREWPDRVEVTAGLTGGETILQHNEPRLRDGDCIVKNADTAPGPEGGQ